MTTNSKLRLPVRFQTCIKTSARCRTTARQPPIAARGASHSKPENNKACVVQRAIATAAAVMTVCTSVPILPAHAAAQQSLAEVQELAARCQTDACKEIMGQLVAKAAAREAGEPEPDFTLTREERRAKRIRERARMEEQNKEFARQKAAFAREERAYFLKYRAMDEEALRLDAAGVPFEERRPIVEKVGEKVFREAMAEQEAFERGQVEFEENLQLKRKAAAERAAAQSMEEQLKKQEDKLCKTSVCS
eukprot:CAMPEP_0114261096 /NCGR_PEP_ID=MMETSP0058-20121206/20908_1 /TAXON_ID=36894 /ORGANISM="Pyramimonas parkeae, CCMP726" /LENGTH=248 /DNA_ID=CAMNT_0001376515 /DNA_START=56 /DNA_END=802 /DNA_ORIENTATION=-